MFNVDVPTACPDVPGEVLNPRNTWTLAADYDAHASALAKMFHDNFQTFEGDVAPDVIAAGPQIR